MAVLSSGTWSDTEITTVTPTSTADYVIDSASCPSMANCEVGIVGAATTVPGFVPYDAGTWGAVQPTAHVSSPDEPGTGNTSGLFAISCQSMSDCTAVVWYENYSGLQHFDGTAWRGIDNTLTAAGGGSQEFLAVSCPTSDSCFASSRQNWLYETSALQTQVSVQADQQGPYDVVVSAGVTWPVLSPTSPTPKVSYAFEGEPIDGCTGLTSQGSSPGPVPSCEVLLSGPGSYSFTVSVDSNPYFVSSTSLASGTLRDAYWEIGADGSVYPFGSADDQGGLSGVPLDKPVVGAALTSTAEGYWLVATDGGLFAFGDAAFYGSMGGRPLNQPIVGMAATPDGGGYWEVASDGGLFAFGDAQFYGSMGGRPLNRPIVGMAVTPDGGGYWEVASDGGLFAFGDAQFYGSMGGRPLNRPIVAMTATPDGAGYWEVASDGGLFAFGSTQFYGSMGGQPLNRPIVGMAATPDGGGYWEVASDGGLFAFGNTQFYGSTGGQLIPAPVVTMLAT
jgi:hypothetical protein